MVFRSAFLCIILVSGFNLNAYSQPFTHQDSLRGSITPERSWWDLRYYHLDISVNPLDSSISGSNTIFYWILEENQVMQIDLQPPLRITKVTQSKIPLDFYRDGNAYFIDLIEMQDVSTLNKIVIYYEGKPKIAKNPPWDGGITWKKDKDGNPFIASTCQGIGASVWWPCKDHMYDEVDSMLISVNVPNHLMDVSNGKLRRVEYFDNGTNTYHWIVKNPISNYAVNINIAAYAHFQQDFEGLKGMLECNYYVLPENLNSAKSQFKDADRTLEAFEYWFGPYPFYEDGYKLVEAPYLGMEHQSSVTYGNGFKNGYNGRDLSGTGWGMKFDFIIVHESAHEWFANSITYKDMADMWIHESFAAYAEGLFVEYFYGKEAGSEYIIGTRQNIKNDKPIIGFYEVNKAGSSDMYPKGSNMLHTLRQLVKDDDKWREILLGLNRAFYHQTVTTQQIEDYLSEQTGIDLQPFFDQYLRDTRIPTLEYSLNLKTLKFRWTSIVNGFDMPVKILIGKKELWIYPSSEWKEIKLSKKVKDIEIVKDFYVYSKKAE